MKNLIIITLFCLQFHFSFLASGTTNQSYLLKGKVYSLEGNRIPYVNISIDGSKYFSADSKGEFNVSLKKELVMPFKVNIISNDYKIKQFTFFDSENRIEIVLSKTEKEKRLVNIQMRDQDGSAVSYTKVNIDGKDYTTDYNGNFFMEITNAIDKDKISVEGFTLSNIEIDDKNNIYKITINKKAPLKEPLEISELEINKSVFIAYKGVFQKLSDDIKEEKKRLEEKNKIIIDKIASITERLKIEKNLSKDQRENLLKEAEALEKSLSENITAFQKSIERTNSLIQNLKIVIMEKDSLNNLTVAKMEKVIKEKENIEENYHRNIIFFSLMFLVFISLSTVLYFNYAKIRKQKSALIKANEDIGEIKNELAKNVVELEQSNEQLEIFVYRASHDIKGPLRSIIGLTTVGQKDVTDPVALNYFDHILKSSKKLDRLLYDLLEISKVKQSLIENNRIDFTELVNDVIQNLQHLPEFNINNFNIEITDKANFYSDRKLVFSIVQNLVENSIKYVDPEKDKSYLNINIASDEKGALLNFSDNGLGIPANLKSKVFDMFFKVDENSDGTGLGLYIVKTTVEKLKGSIHLESEQGQGSTFIIKL